MQKKIIVQKIAEKEGASNGRPWKKIGIMDANNVWYSTFNHIDVKEGGEYMIDYTEKNGFFNLGKIESVSQTENQIANGNRQNSIIRQHSQEMALRWLVSNVNLSITQLDELKPIIDWFEADANSKEEPF